jgi:hypothetical protein
VVLGINFINGQLCQFYNVLLRGPGKVLRGTFQTLDLQNKGLKSVPTMFQLLIYDIVGKALRTANQGHVTANSGLGKPELNYNITYTG